ncbi:hypothetical protein GYA37_01795 [candidate division WWE3 bacterium]|uniref:Uncharacterized protein n=1 Tax=candidate division WWE3 bacterium TaxID=2053526 RepID=A0A7X9HSE3_UNCKA|nr:hypothetical protein [candidate division WWE3 bacterium]
MKTIIGSIIGALVWYFLLMVVYLGGPVMPVVTANGGTAEVRGFAISGLREVDVEEDSLVDFYVDFHNNDNSSISISFSGGNIPALGTTSLGDNSYIIHTRLSKGSSFGINSKTTAREREDVEVSISCPDQCKLKSHPTMLGWILSFIPGMFLGSMWGAVWSDDEGEKQNWKRKLTKS